MHMDCPLPGMVPNLLLSSVLNHRGRRRPPASSCRPGCSRAVGQRGLWQGPQLAKAGKHRLILSKDLKATENVNASFQFGAERQPRLQPARSLLSSQSLVPTWVTLPTSPSKCHSSGVCPALLFFPAAPL